MGGLGAVLGFATASLASQVGKLGWVPLIFGVAWFFVWPKLCPQCDNDPHPTSFRISVKTFQSIPIGLFLILKAEMS